MTVELVSVAGVDKVFRTTAEHVVALANVEFRARAGDLICVHGASGSGKSTLLNVIAGLEVPDGGSVVVAGQELVGASEAVRTRVRLSTMGIVFQDDNLLFELSAAENLQLPLEAMGLTSRQSRAEAESALRRVGLADLVDRMPAEMSGGQQQRVGIARALTGGRSVILADEPTGSLDSDTSRGLFELLRQLANAGSLVVVATHDPLGAEFASRLLDMVDGKLSERAPGLLDFACD